MYLSSTEPPAAAEWACLLRPLRGREPEGIWNLLSIVREMFKRRDSNAAPLLEILTEQCLTHEQVPNLTRPHFTPQGDCFKCKKLHRPVENTCQHLCLHSNHFILFQKEIKYVVDYINWIQDAF